MLKQISLWCCASTFAGTVVIAVGGDITAVVIALVSAPILVKAYSWGSASSTKGQSTCR